jgi:hypothetical protein
MAHLMVLNPMAKRKRRRKMTAKQLEYFGKGRKRKRRTGARRKRKAAKAAVKVIEVRSNPTRGSKMAKRKHRRRHRRHLFRKNPIHRRRFRRNPLESGFLSNTLGPAAIGAAGAIAADYLQGILPLPAGFQQGIMAPITQIGYALLVGLGVDAVAGSKAGGEAAAGGMILAFYNLFSGLGVGGYGYGGGGQMARYMGYLRANPAQLAAVNQRRALRGLQPINTHPRLAGGPIGVRALNPRAGMAGSNVYNRGRSTRLGYIGPARTLGRYMS